MPACSCDCPCDRPGASHLSFERCDKVEGVILFLVIRAQLWPVREGETERWGKWNLIPAGVNDHEQADSGRDRSRDGDREIDRDREKKRQRQRERQRERWVCQRRRRGVVTSEAFRFIILMNYRTQCQDKEAEAREGSTFTFE
jgi:hypothetical protein